jgi:Mg-chelatase subunit ChlD
MTWAAKRQISYFLVFMVIFVVLVGIPLFSLWYHKPTCTDNIQNGGEQGVDCGGSCTRLCPTFVIRPVVEWQQAFEVGSGVYSAVAYVQNPNLNAEAFSVPYTFSFRDGANTIVAERKGSAYIPPGKNFAIFESNIPIPPNTAIHTTFDFTASFDWQKTAGTTTPQVLVKNQHVLGLAQAPTITADLQNATFEDFGRIDVTAIVYDTEGNAVAASKTYVDHLDKQSLAHVAFTWPLPFSGQVTSCQQPTDIVLDIDRSGSMASDGKNPPEPLTSVKNAALSFVNGLSNRGKISVVSFATDASSPIDQVLTSDVPSVRDAINGIEIGTGSTQYTNIADALQHSIDELSTNRHTSSSKQAIVLLTDGKPTYPEKKGDPTYAADTALALARDAQSKGIEIFTIGLGKDIDQDFLKSVSGFDERFFQAPSRQDLLSVYSQIGSSLCKLGPAKVEIIPDIAPL